MRLQTISQTVGVGADLVFPGGKYFMLMETSANVTVTFYGSNNQVIGEATNVDEGFKCAISDYQGNSFLHGKITSASTQTIKS